MDIKKAKAYFRKNARKYGKFNRDQIDAATINLQRIFQETKQRGQNCVIFPSVGDQHTMEDGAWVSKGGGSPVIDSTDPKRQLKLRFSLRASNLRNPAKSKTLCVIADWIEYTPPQNYPEKPPKP